jgi:hypothetical protein
MKLVSASMLVLVALFHKGVAQDCNFSISMPQDITICAPGNVLIPADITGEYFSFEWTGSDGYANNTSLSPTVLVTQTTTYTLSVLGVPSGNQILNGDFSSGNTGFSTNYSFVQDLPGNQNEMYPEGTYTIVTNPNFVHNGFSACSDHTGGGNMMVVNGASALQEVWCQNITINPNSNYIFQAFATSVNPASPAILQFSINGVLLGSPFNLSGAVCDWEEFYTIWNSGTNTNVEICITNQNTAAGGNDFAIDDIFFSEFCNDEEEITVFLQEFDAEISSPPLLNCQNPEGVLSANAVPAGNTYSYQWSTPDGSITTGAGQQSININAPGTYIVTVTDDAGCTKETFAEVEGDFEQPDVSIIGVPIISCTSPVTSLFAASSSTPIGPFTWTLPDKTTQQAQNIDASQAGLYQVQTTGTNGCTGTAMVDVFFETPDYIYQTQVEGPLTCTNKETNVVIVVSSAFDSLSWHGPGIRYQSANRDTITVTKPGYYVFSLFIGQDCQKSDSVLVSELPAQVLYSLSKPDTLTCLKRQTQVNFTPLSLISRWNWISNGQEVFTNTSLIAMNPGNYFLEVFDNQGCRKTDTVTIAGNLAPPVISISVDSIQCATNQGGFRISADDNYTYSWSGTGSTSPNPVFNSPGTYTLTVTGENGCTYTTSLLLPSAKQYPVLTVTKDTITCKKTTGIVTLTSSLPATVSWNGPAGQSGSSPSIASALPGIFSFTATSASGCTATIQAEILIDTTRPVLVLSPSLTLTCHSPSVFPSGYAANYTSFAWSGPSAYTNQTTLSPSLSVPGIYSLTLLNANGCTTERNVRIVEDKALPSFTLEADNITCLQPQSPLRLSGDAGILFFDEKGNQINDGLLLNSAGNYAITAIGPNGCKHTKTITVSAFLDAPDVALDSIFLSCRYPQSKAVDKKFNPENTYLWRVGTNSIESDSLTITSGTPVSLTVTNIYGCKTTVEVPVKENFDRPEANISGPSAIPCQEKDITLQVDKPQPFTIYSWSVQNVLNTISTSLTVADSGTVILTAFNEKNGCSSTTEKVIAKITGPQELPLNILQPKCFGEFGTLTILPPKEGTPPFTWLLDTKAVSQNTEITVSSGKRELVITDGNGCTLKREILIDSPVNFAVNAGRDTTIAYSDQVDLSAFTTLAEANRQSITWTPGESLNCLDCLRPKANPEADTRYTITVTDQNGCSQTDDVLIRVRFDKGIVAPNIMTRRNTGGNNQFTLFPVKSSVSKINLLTVYDRWGNSVFSVSDIEPGNPSLGWDGTRNGSPMAQGVYVWIAEVTYKDQSTEWLKGDITVID